MPTKAMKSAGHSKIIIGTRGSELARTQTRMVADELFGKRSDIGLEIKIVRTRGDEGPAGSSVVPADVRAGRKGLFTQEIERALVDGEIDLAVHSAKDLPSELATGTEIVAVLPRAAVDDVLVATAPCDLESLSKDGVVATGSVRRKHQLRWKRPDLQIVDLYGNVPTRLRKIAQNQWHGIILARAGLERLGLRLAAKRIRFEGREFSVEVLPRQVFLPAGGQGIIAVQGRSGDSRLKELVDQINHFATWLCLRAEREFLRLLHADCNQPVGVLASVDGEKMITMHAQIFDPGATTPRVATVQGPSEQTEQLAEKLMQQINGR
jgi:hydroxymethylbilane synthase